MMAANLRTFYRFENSDLQKKVKNLAIFLQKAELLSVTISLSGGIVTNVCSG